MAGESVTSMSLIEVREFLEEKHPFRSAWTRWTRCLGLVLAVAGTAVGATTGLENGLVFWHAIEPKNVVIDALRVGVRKLSARGTAESDVYLERIRRMAAANCLLVYTAYFDALMRLSRGDGTAGLEAPEARAELLNIRELGRRQADDAARHAGGCRCHAWGATAYLATVTAPGFTRSWVMSCAVGSSGGAYLASRWCGTGLASAGGFRSGQ